MKKSSEGKFSKEHLLYTKCIFLGMTIPQMAKKLYCSQSNVSYHLGQIYAKYKVKNRHELMLRIFSKILDEYKTKIIKKEIEEEKLANKINLLQNTLSKIILNKKNPELFEYWTKEARKLI